MLEEVAAFATPAASTERSFRRWGCALEAGGRDRSLRCRISTGFTEPKLIQRQNQARLRVAKQRCGAASFACNHERRMVDLTGIEPVTS